MELQNILTRGDLPAPSFGVSDITCMTIAVPMRDGIRLATDLYLPPVPRAPAVVIRTPYGRSRDDSGLVGTLLAFARRGYVAVSQDCRGTGQSEPDTWDYYVYESEDGYDLIEWMGKQAWFDGFVGSFGGSYAGQTQWCMAVHPAMSTTVPNVSGLGFASNTAHLYMYLNAYARCIGKGDDKVAIDHQDLERVMLEETLAGGYFNEPLHTPLATGLLARFPQLGELSSAEAKRALWRHYCKLSSGGRAAFIKAAFGTNQVSILEMEALASIFGQRISHDAHTIPNPSPPDLCRLIQAPPLLRTGWYDWGLNDALETWALLRREGRPEVASRARLLITPYAHNMPGYHEGMEAHPELLRQQIPLNPAGLLLRWYAAVREGGIEAWPTVIYYLMGANEWRHAADWPVPNARPVTLYLDGNGSLTTHVPRQSAGRVSYMYDPSQPTPTVGGSIVSSVYPPGSVDVATVQGRSDLVVFTTAPLQRDLDVVGPLRMVLYASSSALDTDFVARLSDVFPDGRAVQIQNGILRARHRNLDGEPEWLEPGKIYRFEIDMWATANRFLAGHRLRIDISSADFPRFDRNSNRGGVPGEPVPAHQTIYLGAQYRSHLVASVLGDGPVWETLAGHAIERFEEGTCRNVEH